MMKERTLAALQKVGSLGSYRLLAAHRAHVCYREAAKTLQRVLSAHCRRWWDRSEGPEPAHTNEFLRSAAFVTMGFGADISRSHQMSRWDVSNKGVLFAPPVLCVIGPALAVHVVEGHPVHRAATGDDPQSRWQFCFPSDQFYKSFFPILAMAPAMVAADFDGG